MTKIVIDVHGLGKRYALSHAHRPDSLKVWLRNAARQITSTDGQPASEEFWALKDISLQVHQGDCLALTGENGSGKSTLLKILSRIVAPTQGTVTIRGRVVSLLEVGAGFHPDLTGRENIFLNGAILGCPEPEVRRRFDQIVDFSGVERFLDTPVKYYSSGMYVRLAYSVAAHVDSEIQIVDEVLSVGDSGFQEKCLARITEYLRSGNTVIFVSHNTELVGRLSTRIARLESGILSALETRIVAGAPAPAGDTGKAECGSSADNSDLRQTWEGVDGSDGFRMYATYAKSSGGFPASTSEPITIGWHGELFEAIDQLIGAVEIRSHSGQVLVYCAYDDTLPPPTPTVVPGRFSWELTIPPDTLAEGIYEIVFDIGIHNIKRLVTDACKLRIQVTNPSGRGRRHPCDAWHSLMRPDWPWKRNDSPRSPL